MIATTTPSIEGKKVVAYKGIVFGEVVSGVNFLKDFTAGLRNFFGGRSGSYENELIKARENAIEEMQQRAQNLGANAVIGVDIDQSAESEKVITSAMKSVKEAIYQALTDYQNDKFSGGNSLRYDAKSNGVCLPMDTSRFEKFNQEDYDSIFSRLVDGTIDPYDGTDIGTTQELTLINTFVNYIVL